MVRGLLKELLNVDVVDGAGRAGILKSWASRATKLSSPMKFRLIGELGVESLNDLGSNLMRCSSTLWVMVRPFFSVTVVVCVFTNVGVVGVLGPSPP